MTLRSKMVATISAFCLVLAMLIIGVWAAQSVKIEMGGSLTFDANDVNVKIEGTITGASEPQTLDTLIFSANDGESSGDVETWKNKSLTFGRNDDEVYDIVIAIKITNLSKENAVNVKILDNYQTIENVDKTITRDDGQYTAGFTYSLPKSTTESESTTTFKLTFSVADKNQPVSGVQFGYTIDLSDESYKAPSPVTAQGSGTVDFVDNGDGTISLTAKPTENSLFIGWQDVDGNFKAINYLSVIVAEIGFLVKRDYPDAVSDDLYNYVFFDVNSIDLSQVDYDPTIAMLKYNYGEIVEDIEAHRCTATVDYKQGADSFVGVFISKDSIKEEIFTDEDGLTYKLYNDLNLAIITSYNGNASNLVINSQVINAGEKYDVVGCQQDLYSIYNNGEIVSWINNDNVTSIELKGDFIGLASASFLGITQIKSLSIEGNLGQCGDGVFG